MTLHRLLENKDIGGYFVEDNPLTIYHVYHNKELDGYFIDIPDPNAQLTPSLFSPLGQWACDMAVAPSGADLPDRITGLAARAMIRPSFGVPDARVNSGAIFTRLAGSGTCDMVGGPQAALQLTGELTVTCKAWWNRAELTPTVSQVMVQMRTFLGSAVNADNCLYAMYVSDAGFLSYFAQQGAAVSIVYNSPLFLDSSNPSGYGPWRFVSLRRTAAGVVTLGVNGNFATSGALAVPNGGTNARLRFGSTNNNERFTGAISDVSIWNTRLTDDQINSLRTVAMGNIT